MRRYVFSIIALGLVALVVLAGCVRKKEVVTTAAPNRPAVLVSWMTGSFSSQAQAEADSSFYDIRLEMAPIWENRSDGHWLYVEQAVASHLDQPYRQRVYHVTQLDDTTFASKVYAMDQPDRFIGVWRNTDLLLSLTPDSLEERLGCTIILSVEGDTAFVGSTVGMECLSTLRGAAYATSEVRISSDFLYSWDRGFDSTNTQVWGAETGGYHFDRILKADSTSTTKK